MLFDVLYDSGTSFRLLRDCNFRPQWNVPYSHGLSDEDLRATLERLVSGGLLHSAPSDSPRDMGVYGITQAGHVAWERERLPQWERYAVGAYHVSETNQCEIQLHCSTSKATIDHFEQVGRERNLWGRFGTRVRRFVAKRYHDYRLPPWRPATTLYGCGVLYGSIQRLNRSAPPVTEAERRHSYYVSAFLGRPPGCWRNVIELQQFLPQRDT